MSLLSIIIEVTGRLALPQPSSVIGSTDAQIQQLLALTNKSGHDLAQAFNWQALMTEGTFTTVAQTEQTGVLPDDFDRFVPNSFWNRDTRRPVIGPVTPQQWQALAAQPALSTVYLMFRERQGKFLMGPPSVPPPAGQTIAYEYVSKNWAKSSGGTPQDTFSADGDTSYLDEHLIADDVVWRFLRAKGMSYAEEMATFGRNLDQQKGRDGGATALTLTPTPIDLDRVNLPDGDFPGVP